MMMPALGFCIPSPTSPPMRFLNESSNHNRLNKYTGQCPNQLSHKNQLLTKKQKSLGRCSIALGCNTAPSETTQ